MSPLGFIWIGQAYRRYMTAELQDLFGGEPTAALGFPERSVHHSPLFGSLLGAGPFRLGHSWRRVQDPA